MDRRVVRTDVSDRAYLMIVFQLTDKARSAKRDGTLTPESNRGGVLPGS
jgi:hypothetical protein